MAAGTRRDARLNFRLPADLKELIEEAAARQGQSVSDFAVGTLVQAARTIAHQQSVTELSNQDREVFVALLDNNAIKPNRALVRAAAAYKARVKQ